MFIEVSNLSHNYNPDLAPDDYTLENINFTIEHGEFVGLVGHTGSGKSTLVQTLNGLVDPTAGQINIAGVDITASDNLQEIRQQVGLVFQYPEHQLFEETVFADIAFGPRNLGVAEDEIEPRVKEALQLVNLEYESFKDQSPFRLSGGQQRRVAIAGVLAMKPEVLILDEPTAGLDPKARKDLLAEIVRLQEEFSLTIILISHRMEEIAQLADKVLVLEDGELVLQGSPSDIFAQSQFLEKINLGVPQVTEVLQKLKAQDFAVACDLFDVTEAAEEILQALRG